MREGMIAGVIEVTPRGMAEEMLGGNGGGGPDRVLAAAECGVPQVVAPSGFDLLAVGGQPDVGGALRRPGPCRHRRAPRPRAHLGRRVPGDRWGTRHAVEPLDGPVLGAAAVARMVVAGPRRLRALRSEADQAFADELAVRLDRPERIRTVDANLYSAEFGAACVEAFLEVWAESGREYPLPALAPGPTERGTTAPGVGLDAAGRGR